MQRKDEDTEEGSDEDISDWEPNTNNIVLIWHEIRNRFRYGRKSNLENPKIAGLTAEEDGRVPATMPPRDFVEACAKIGAFLMDKEAFIKQLKKLNHLISKKCENKPLTVSLLRKTLEQELAKENFHPKFGKTFGNVPPDAFRSTIAHGLLLKDAILGDQAHGELIHAIQWLMIAWQDKTTFFLDEDVIDIFKRLGEEESVFERDPFYEGMSIDDRRSEVSLWDIIVDNSGTNDFRSPSTLNEFIQNSDDEELSLLKKLLTSRTEKRKKEETSQKLKQQYEKPKIGFYHKGNLPYVHEPITSNIDLKKFRNKSSKK